VFAPQSGRYLLLGAALLGGVAVAEALGWIRSWWWVGALLVGLGLFGFLVWFFRDPERSIGDGIVSPADGRVLVIGAEGDRWQIGVFMNVTDVHVNRFPIDGTVTAITPAGEGFRPAYASDAAHNVRLHYQLTTSIGPVEIVQMTGVVARRLVPFVGVGATGRKGDRLGMIVLGSRVDLLFDPARARPTVQVGDRVTAGMTRVAREVGS